MRPELTLRIPRTPERLPPLMALGLVVLLTTLCWGALYELVCGAMWVWRLVFG